MRKSYLIHKAFRKFLTASILSAAAAQLAITTDAVIVGQLLGADALSAINLIIPLAAVLEAIGVLFASGTEIVIVKSFGEHDETLTANIFSTSIMLSAGLGIFISVILLAGGGWFLSHLYPAVKQLTMAQEYLPVYALGIVFLFVGLTIQFLMDADGNPATTTKLVVLSGIANIILDIVFIKYLRIGIRGSALATGISFSIPVIGSLPYFLKKTCSFRWRMPGFHQFRNISCEISKNGLLLFATNMVMALFVFLINAIILRVSDAGSLFTWSVCVQVMLLTTIAINGGIMVMFGLGGTLFGEHDLRGLKFLSRRIIFSIIIFFLLFIATVLLWPDWLIVIFQNGAMAVPANCGHRIAIFCLMFLPFSVVMVTAALYQVLEYKGIGIVLMLGLFIGMILAVLGLSFISVNAMWWGFPVGGGAVLFGQLLYCTKLHLHDPGRCFFTLVPRKFEGKILDLSVKYTRESLVGALNSLDAFLKDNALPPKLIFRLHLCADELMQNLLEHAANAQTTRCFDLQITTFAEKTTLLLKDDGPPFNPTGMKMPVHQINSPRKGLGLILVKGMAPKLSYKYSYGQNTVFVAFLHSEFPKKGE